MTLMPQRPLRGLGATGHSALVNHNLEGEVIMKYTMEDYEAMTKDELIMAIIEERMKKALEDYKPRYEEMKEKYNIAKAAYDISQSELEDIQDDYKELYEKYILTSRQLEQLLNCFAPKPYYSEGKWWCNGANFIYQEEN